MDKAMGKLIGTFPTLGEFEGLRSALEALSLPHEVIRPDPAYAAVGVPALVIDEEARRELTLRGREGLGCSGWVAYRPNRATIPTDAPPAYREDRVGRLAVMVMGSCIGDRTKLRLIAQIAGDLAEAFPFLNAELPRGLFNPAGPTFTFMEGHRMVTLYPRRVFVAKADDLVDAWRILERTRRLVNEVWARRAAIQPSYERRSRPTALGLYAFLPKTNCGACGEGTCLAFALRLWAGEVGPELCEPVWSGSYAHLRPALEGACAGLGTPDPAATAAGS